MSVVTAPAPTRRRPNRSMGRRFLRVLGWCFVGGALVVVLFILYQLFVTNLITDRIQDGLRREVIREFERTDAGGGGGEPAPIPGEGVAILRVPDIDLDAVVVEGVGIEELKRGPGHYPSTPMPGEGGNVGIAGHRTTYAKPFWALDELDRGDQILVRTGDGRFVYEVTWARVVGPEQAEVLDEIDPAGGGRPDALPCADEECITLTTCHPRFSAAQRLIVRGVLVDGPIGAETAA